MIRIKTIMTGATFAALLCFANPNGALAFSPNAAVQANSGAYSQSLAIEAGRRGRGRRNLGLGIVAGVTGAILLNEAAKAEERRYSRGEIWESRRCRRLDIDCADGDPRACDLFEDHCE